MQEFIISLITNLMGAINPSPQPHPSLHTQSLPQSLPQSYSSRSQSQFYPQIQSVQVEGMIIPEEMFERIEGRALNKNPHHSIVAITCHTDEGQPFYASGVLLSKNLVLTSAHTIFYNMKVNTDFKVYYLPNGVGLDNYFECKSWKYLPEFQGPKIKLKYDYALIKIEEDKNLPISYEDFPQLMVTCEECFHKGDQLKIGIFGYPLNYMNNFKYLEEGGIRLFQYGFRLKGRVQQIDHKNFRISYKINTEGGHSGSPIMMEQSIIGIHNGKKDNLNIGRLITVEVAQNILKWSQQLRGDPIQIQYNRDCCKKQRSMIVDNSSKKLQDKTASIENKLANNLTEPIKAPTQLLEVSKDIEIVVGSQKQPFPIKMSTFQTKPIILEPLAKLQEKAIQVKQQYISQIVKKLQNIPSQEKQRITSLTLKATVTILQKSVL